MTGAALSPEDRAAALWAARRAGGTLPACPIADEDDAYAVQEATIAAAPEPIVGWKVGATGAGAPARLGLSGPFCGPIVASALYDGRTAVPAQVRLPAAQGLAAEVEIAFRIGADGKTPDAVALALELPASRFAALPSPPGLAYIADHGGTGAAVIGPWVADDGARDCAAVSARLEIDGALVAGGVGAAALGDPRAALRLAAAQLAARGRGLRPGDVVLTGTLTGITPFAPGARIVGRAAPLPDVAAIVEAW